FFARPSPAASASAAEVVGDAEREAAPADATPSELDEGRVAALDGRSGDVERVAGGEVEPRSSVEELVAEPDAAVEPRGDAPLGHGVRRCVRKVGADAEGGSDPAGHVPPDGPTERSSGEVRAEVARIAVLLVTAQADVSSPATGPSNGGGERGAVDVAGRDVLPCRRGDAVLVDSSDAGPVVRNSPVIRREAECAPRRRGGRVQSERVGVLGL